MFYRVIIKYNNRNGYCIFESFKSCMNYIKGYKDEDYIKYIVVQMVDMVTLKIIKTRIIDNTGKELSEQDYEKLL